MERKSSPKDWILTISKGQNILNPSTLTSTCLLSSDLSYGQVEGKQWKRIFFLSTLLTSAVPKIHESLPLSLEPLQAERKPTLQLVVSLAVSKALGSEKDGAQLLKTSSSKDLASTRGIRNFHVKALVLTLSSNHRACPVYQDCTFSRYVEDHYAIITEAFSPVTIRCIVG